MRNMEQIQSRIAGIEHNYSRDGPDLVIANEFIEPLIVQIHSLRQELDATNQQVVHVYEQDFQRQIDSMRSILNRILRITDNRDRPQSMREEHRMINPLNRNQPEFEDAKEQEDIFLDRNPRQQHQRYPNPNHEVSPQRLLVNPPQIS